MEEAIEFASLYMQINYGNHLPEKHEVFDACIVVFGCFLPFRAHSLMFVRSPHHSRGS
jgi:hypothetical protein